ncbi:hypothetical protein KPL47_06730 [Clostridium estertheticum]|uniref:hypothetical protein n=1 Tax=Clostridium estertheticum TaxID=238834 RepID=UPI001C0C14BF|nr:hypothetical protein [Clostridium estertheticum]MBU3176061.1 hypothetical protein [Clostridium estertheticum]
MQINENWKIESNADNVTLLQRRITQPKDTSQAPRTSWKPGYYGNVQQALKGLATNEINATGLKNIEVIVKKQDEIFKLIDSIKIITMEKVVYKNRKENVDEDEET